MPQGESEIKISNGARLLILGALFTFMGIVKLWLWFSGVANEFALWFGLLFCSAGPYFLFSSWRAHTRTGDSTENRGTPGSR